MRSFFVKSVGWIGDKLSPGFIRDFKRALLVGRILDTPTTGPRRRVRNLKALLDIVDDLCSRGRLAEWEQIHSLILNRDWTIRNTAAALMERYASQLIDDPLDALRAAECKVYSQNGEDGIILYLFSRIGWGSKTYFNLGGGGVSSNTANLLRHWGWRGVEVDASDDSLRTFSETHIKGRRDLAERISLRREWVTRENVNRLAESEGLKGEIGLLSIDLDGNDYWIWEALECVSPRVVVMEYNAFFGRDRSISVVYDPVFDRRTKHSTTWYCGASLKALVKLGQAKGYAFVGCESNGVNAFFVRKDLLGGRLEAVEPEAAYYPHFQQQTRITPEGLESLLNDMEYVEI